MSSPTSSLITFGAETGGGFLPARAGFVVVDGVLLYRAADRCVAYHTGNQCFSLDDEVGEEYHHTLLFVGIESTSRLEVVASEGIKRVLHCRNVEGIAKEYMFSI